MPCFRSSQTSSNSFLLSWQYCFWRVLQSSFNLCPRLEILCKNHLSCLSSTCVCLQSLLQTPLPASDSRKACSTCAFSSAPYLKVSCLCSFACTAHLPLEAWRYPSTLSFLSCSPVRCQFKNLVLGSLQVAMVWYQNRSRRQTQEFQSTY